MSAKFGESFIVASSYLRARSSSAALRRWNGVPSGHAVEALIGRLDKRFARPGPELRNVRARNYLLEHERAFYDMRDGDTGSRWYGHHSGEPGSLVGAAT